MLTHCQLYLGCPTKGNITKVQINNWTDKRQKVVNSFLLLKGMRKKRKDGVGFTYIEIRKKCVLVWHGGITMNFSSLQATIFYWKELMMCGNFMVQKLKGQITEC